MMIIKCLSEKIDEELHDAEAYVDLAMKWKQDEPDTAELFYTLYSIQKVCLRHVWYGIVLS